MKNLFGDNRIANILNILRKGSSMTLSMLSNKLSVSERSIRNDIKTINEAIENTGIIEITNGTCSLRIFDKEGFKEAYAHIIDTDSLVNSSSARKNYIFGKLMRAVSPLLTDDLAYEMNVGRTTLIKDLNKLREEISNYQLEIVGKTSQGLMLQGPELEIRRYVIENMYNDIYNDYPLDQEVREQLDLSFEYHPFERAVRESFYQYLTLMLDRFLTGHFVGRLPDEYYAMTARGGFVFVDRLVNRIGSLLHVEFPIEEKIYLLLPIIGMRTPLDSNNLYNIELDNEVGPLMDKILVGIDHELNVQIDPKNFTNEFQYHLMFMINRLRYGIHLDNPLMEEIQKKYPLAYQMAVISSRIIENTYKLQVNESEKGFLASYFGVFIEVNGLEHPKQSVALVCGSGTVSIQLLLVQLKKVIDSQTKMTIFSLDEISAEILNRYDVIITTLDIPFVCDSPVLRIQEIFDEEDLKNRLNKAQYIHHNDSSIDDNRYLLASLIKEENFFDLSDYDSYEEAVNFMIDCLNEDGDVDDDFKQRLWEREKQGSMIVDNVLAIPHTIQTIKGETTIAIGKFNEPISYKDYQISIVLLMAIPTEISEEGNRLIRIYDEILTIAKDESLMNKLLNVKSYTDFCIALYEKY